MNKRYEEGREPFFSEPGEKMRKQFVWTKDEMPHIVTGKQIGRAHV